MIITNMPAQKKTSSWSIGIASIRDTARLYGPALRLSAFSFLILHVIKTGADQYLTFSMDTLMKDGRERFLAVILIVALNLTFNLLWSTFWILRLSETCLAVLERRTPKKLLEILPLNFNQLLIEQLRSLAAILLRIPLLIVPALVEYVRLSFVPLIVILDPAYQRGEVDVLKQSRQLLKKRFVLLLGWLVLSLFIPLVVEDLVQDKGGALIWQNPSGVALSMALTLFINLATGIFLFALYRRISMMSRDPLS
jgi:hypothetical protein